MRLLILCAVMLLTGMQARSQRIRLSLNNASFKELFTIAEQQTRFSFIYTSEQLQLLPPITIDDSVDLFSLLTKQLQHTQIGFTTKGDFIILVSKKNSHTVKGKVIDQSGKPVEGLTVQPLNEHTVTLTDLAGCFEIKNIAADTRLTITGAEIETSIVKVSGRDYIEIVVSELIRELEETVVPGYGSIKKRFNTGNIVKVNFAELPPSSTGNLLTSLQARVPGLLITATGGAPSSSYVMQIRGQHSINPNPLINYRIPPLDQPLVIIDGVPFAPQNNNVNQLVSIAAPGNLEFYQNPYGGISPFSLINPEMIENVEILKDAVSTSIYGSRAANGILLISTRKPKTNDLLIETNALTGINLIADRPSMLGVKEYLDLRKAAFISDSIQPNLIQGSPAYAPDLLKYDQNKETDWGKYFFHTAVPLCSINTTVQGQAGKLSFLSGLTIRHEKYLLKGDFFAQRFSSNNQLKYTSADRRLNISTGVIYTHSWNRSLASPSIFETIRLPPNYPHVYDEAGNINWNDNGVELNDNPAALLRQTYKISASNILISPSLTYKISKDLIATLNVGYNDFITEETAIFPMSSFSVRNQRAARSVFAHSRFLTKLFEPQLEYKIAPGRFRFTVLSGMTLQQNKVNLSSIRGTQYADESLMSSAEGAGKIDMRSIDDSYRYMSYFGSIDIQYAQKYLLHLSGRYETSSKFAEDSKTGRFSSIGMGWIISEEAFVKRCARWLRFGKLRTSYGTTGNDNVGYYHYLNAWVQTPTYFGNSTSSNIPNSSFGWSVTKKLEAGLELKMLKNRLSLDISVYKHHSSDQLISQLSITPPARTRYLSNFPAVVENSGVEIIATASSDREAKINWISQVNISIPYNKLKEFPFIENSLYSGVYWLNKPLGTVESIHYNGIDTTTGFFSFDEKNKSYLVRTPKVYGGWWNKISTKRWTIEVLVEFRIQNGINYLKQASDEYPGKQYNLPSIFSSENNPDKVPLQRAALPSNPDARLSAYYLSLSDAAFSNASYLRIRSFMISRYFNKGTAKNTRVYLQMQNVITFSALRLTDPEIQNFYTYPQSKSIIIGMTVTL